MTTVRDALVAILSDAQSLQARFALVGGLGISVWTEPRTTRDVDLAVDVADDAGVERLVFSLLQRGYLVESVIEQVVLGRVATVRLRPPGAEEGGALVDLLFASSGVEPEVVRSAQPIELLRGVTAPVASVGHLIVLKLLARDDDRRPQDAVDLAALIRRAGAADLAEAGALARLIVDLGTNRRRDLVGLLAAAVARFARG